MRPRIEGLGSVLRSSIAEKGKQMSSDYHPITYELSWRDVLVAWMACIIGAAICFGFESFTGMLRMV